MKSRFAHFLRSLPSLSAFAMPHLTIAFTTSLTVAEGVLKLLSSEISLRLRLLRPLTKFTSCVFFFFFTGFPCLDPLFVFLLLSNLFGLGGGRAFIPLTFLPTRSFSGVLLTLLSVLLLLTLISPSSMILGLNIGLNGIDTATGKGYTSEAKTEVIVGC